MAEPTQAYQTARLQGFVGIDERSRTGDVPPQYLRKAYNVDISSSGTISRRHGVTAIGEGGHSGFQALDGRLYYVRSRGTMFCRLYPDGSVTELASLSSSSLVSYAELDDRVFFSNGTDHHAVTQADGILPWTFPTPPPPQTSGAGDRFVRVVAVFGNNVESAPSKAVQCNSGETINVPSHPGAVGFALYWTFPNGTEFYYGGATSSSGGAYLIGDHRPGAHALSTHRTIMFPAGQKLAAFYRRVLSAQGNVLWYSDLESPHLADLNGFFQFEDAITLVAPLVDGCYVGTEGALYWLAGDDPTQWARREVARGYVLQQRVAKRLPGDTFPSEGATQIVEHTPVWIDDELLICRPSGNLTRASRGRVAPDLYRAVVISYRVVDGTRQIISRFTDKIGESQYRATDPTVTDFYNRPKGI